MSHADTYQKNGSILTCILQRTIVKVFRDEALKINSKGKPNRDNTFA